MTQAKKKSFLAPNSRHLRAALFVLLPRVNTPVRLNFNALAADVRGALLVLLPGVKRPMRPRQKHVSLLRSTSEGRRLVSFHMLRAPYDLGK